MTDNLQPEIHCRDAAFDALRGLMDRNEYGPGKIGSYRAGAGQLDGIPYHYTIGGFLRCNGRVLSTTPTQIAVVFDDASEGGIFLVRSIIDEIEAWDEAPVPGSAAEPGQLELFEVQP